MEEYKDEREISIIDLLYQICRRWRTIIALGLICAVLGLICAVLGCAYAYRSAAKSETVLSPSERLESLNRSNEEILGSLSDEEENEVNSAYSLYKIRENEYANSTDYLNNSLLMKTNLFAAPTIDLLYSVSAGSQSIESFSNIVSSYYRAEILDHSTFESIEQSIDYTFSDPQKADGYISELISFDSESEGIMKISVLAPDKETCSRISDIIISRVDEVTPEVKKAVGNFDLNLISSVYYEKFDPDAYGAQNEIAEKHSSLITALDQVPTTFSDDQKSYYNNLLEISETEALLADSSLISDSDSTSPASVNAGKPAVSSIVKYAIIGLIAGAFIVCAIIACAYIFAPYIHSEDDIADMYGIPTIGVFRSPQKKLKGLDKWIYSIFHRKEKPVAPMTQQLTLAISGLRVLIAKKDLHKLYFISSVDNESTKNYMSMVAQELRSEVECTIGSPISSDSDALELAASTDGVVFFEAVNASTYNDFNNEVTTCQKYNIPVIGSIIAL